VFGDLMRGRDALQSGATPYSPAATMAVRVRMMDNINEYTDLVKSACVDPSEVEGAILENYGEVPSSYEPRITGTAKKEARLGLINDFAAYTAKTPYQVVVIDTANIWSDTPDEELLKRAVRKAEIKTDTEFVKSRVLCAVLHKNHYDLGVVRSAGSIQSVFAAGAEWEAAEQLILAFVKSKAPSPCQERGELCPRWVPPVPAPAHTPHTPATESKRKTKRIHPQTHAHVGEQERARKRTRPLPPPLFLLRRLCLCRLCLCSPVALKSTQHEVRVFPNTIHLHTQQACKVGVACK
jgi:hypothetical protein